MKFLTRIWRWFMDVKMSIRGAFSNGALWFETKSGQLIITVLFSGTQKHIRIALHKLPRAVEWIRAQPYGRSVVFRGGDDAWVYVPDYLTSELRKFLEDVHAAAQRGSKSDFTLGDVPNVNTKDGGPRAVN